MNNTALLYAAKSIASTIEKEIKTVNNMVKEDINIKFLMDAKTIPQESAHFYENLKDMYVNIDFGNNVVLPFYIDRNIACCLKTLKPKKNRVMKSITDLKKHFGLKTKDSIYDVAAKIEELYGFDLKIEEKPVVSYVSKKASLGDALGTLSGTPWEASLKRFMGEAEKIIGHPEQLIEDEKLLKSAKKTLNILGKMESKQKAILERNPPQNDNFVEVRHSTRKSFDKESVQEFLKVLASEDIQEYSNITRESREEAGLKMVGIFHLDELVEISPSLQSVLDMELSAKISYQIEMSKQDKEEEDLKASANENNKEEVGYDHFIEELSEEDLEIEEEIESLGYKL